MLRVLVMAAATMLITIQPSFAFQAFTCEVVAATTSDCEEDKNNCSFTIENAEQWDPGLWVLMINWDQNTKMYELYAKQKYFGTDISDFVKGEKIGSDPTDYFFQGDISGATNIENLFENQKRRKYKDKATIPWVQWGSDYIYATQLSCKVFAF